jgi:hypothetical protein
LDAAPEPQAGERLMDDEDITTLDDPDFFAERRRVRELIEHPAAASRERGTDAANAAAQ